MRPVTPGTGCTNCCTPQDVYLSLAASSLNPNQSTVLPTPTSAHLRLIDGWEHLELRLVPYGGPRSAFRGVGEKMNAGSVLAFARMAVVVPVTLSKTSRVGLTLQKKD